MEEPEEIINVKCSSSVLHVTKTEIISAKLDLMEL
jgi:hypothetical protein